MWKGVSGKSGTDSEGTCVPLSCGSWEPLKVLEWSGAVAWSELYLGDSWLLCTVGTGDETRPWGHESEFIVPSLFSSVLGAGGPGSMKCWHLKRLWIYYRGHSEARPTWLLRAQEAWEPWPCCCGPDPGPEVAAGVHGHQRVAWG